MNFVTYSGVRNPRWAGKGLGGGDRVGGRGGGVAIVRRGEEEIIRVLLPRRMKTFLD